MGRLIQYILAGVLVDIILFALHYAISDDFFANTIGNNIMLVVYLLGIIVPCAIYYIKTPPGQDTRP